ncbi:MAG: lipoprotein [Pseudomonadota bacterium]
MSRAAVLVCLLACGTLTGCGLTGDLYLPEPSDDDAVADAGDEESEPEADEE